MAKIIEIQAPSSIGCGCYSEGVNDDVNKYVWTALHWGNDEKGPLSNASHETQIQALLIQYSSFLVGLTNRSQAELLAEGILCLESNWHEPLRTSKSVQKSISIFDKIEENLTPLNRKNWRLNLLFLRVCHDAFLYSRLRQETSATASALLALSTASSSRPLSKVSIKSAIVQLSRQYSEPPIFTSSYDKDTSSLKSGINVLSCSIMSSTITHLYARIISLCALLYEQIGYQTSIGLGGQHRQRGAYVDMAWVPLGDVQYMKYVLDEIFQDTKHDDTTSALIRRFKDSLMERLGYSHRKVLWYASFGDLSANECIGCVDLPTRYQSVHEVVSPHRKIQIGEDPIHFQRSLNEYLDTANDVVLRKIHEGRVPRAWRSCITPIWPRTASLTMKFEMLKLLPENNKKSNKNVSIPKLSVRVTYLMEDLNIHGGDWEELGRRGMGTKLEANDVMVHDYIQSERVTQSLLFRIPDQAMRRAMKSGVLEFRWIPERPKEVTFVDTPLPIAELWILNESCDVQSHL